MPVCLNCDERKPACHDTCGDYAEEKAENKHKNALLQKQKENNQYRRSEHIGAFSAQRK